MPGKSVKNWPVYHALRKDGVSKERAAKVANAHATKTKKRGA